MAKTFSCPKRCGFCCSFFVIKTKNRACKIKKVLGTVIIETELRPVYDAKFFEYHGILFCHNKRAKKLQFVFETDKDIKSKMVKGEKWFKIPLPCKYLIDNKCKVYRARPLACKVSQCSLNDEDYTKW